MFLNHFRSKIPLWDKICSWNQLAIDIDISTMEIQKPDVSGFQMFEMCLVMEWSGFQIPFENRMVDHSETGHFGLVFKCTLKTGWLKHQFFKVFSFQMAGFWIPTVFAKPLASHKNWFKMFQTLRYIRVSHNSTLFSRHQTLNFEC